MSDAELIDESKGTLLLAVSIGVVAAATIAVAMRWIARLLIIKKLGADDIWMLAALLFAWAGVPMNVIEVHHGLGRHTQFIPPLAQTVILQHNWVAEIMSILGFWCWKIAIAVLLLRFMGTEKIYRYILWVTVVAITAITISGIVMTIQCIPVQAAWDMSLRSSAQCISQDRLVEHAYASGVINALLDIVYTVVPIFFIRGLQLRMRDKVGLTALLLFSCVACACAIVKITLIANLGKTTDFSWNFTDLALWNIVELNVGIIAGSIPPMRPLFKEIWKTASSLATGRSRTKEAYDTGEGPYIRAEGRYLDNFHELQGYSMKDIKKNRTIVKNVQVEIEAGSSRPDSITAMPLVVEHEEGKSPV